MLGSRASVSLLEGPYMGRTRSDLLEWETLIARDIVLHLNFNSLDTGYMCRFVHGTVMIGLQDYHDAEV